MTIIYSVTLKNTRLDAVTTALGATSKIVIMTSADAVLAELPLANPAAPAAAAGVLTLTAGSIEDPAANATGIAAKAKIVDSAAGDAVTGLTVGTAATDIILDSVDITSGQTVTINSAVITHG